jgi:hypothetical protein
MPKLTKDKIRINVTIDKELNEILHRREENKSALISSLLWKFLGKENNSQDSGLKTQVSKECRFRDLNSGPLDYESSTLTN